MLRDSKETILMAQVKKKIAFVLEGWPLPYDYVSASVRLRAYDIIRLFKNDIRYSLELYRPWKRYDAVIFLKRDSQAFLKAKKLKAAGTKIMLDVNAHIFDQSLYGKGFFKNFDQNYFDTVSDFARLSDAITVTSPYLLEQIGSLFGPEKVVLLPENIPTNHRCQERVERDNNALHFVYIGYASKANQISLLAEQFQKLSKNYSLHYTLICERDPKLSIPNIDFTYIPFNNRTLYQNVFCGDIFLSPRDTSDAYNLAHSFTKIGLPMSLGIPVVASPLPAYENSPAVLIGSLDDGWTQAIIHLATDTAFYQKKSDEGIRFCQDNFSPEVTHKKYTDFFSRTL